MREWPRTPREHRLWMEQGKYAAAAERWRACCLALGSSPPTPGEMDRIRAGKVPAGFGCLPTLSDRSVWQFGRLTA